ncbi:MAG TPA: hypothetical protein VHS78_10890 [Candidatus Elarobacter sp.]|nr:hypothetical protein [Candidatus Elarobacter sp.]
MPLLEPAFPDGLAPFLQTVLRNESQDPHRQTFRNWAVGNLEIFRIEEDVLLYGKAGHSRRVHAEQWEHEHEEFEDVELDMSNSVSFIFDGTTELTAIQHRATVGATQAARRIEYIFNHAPPDERQNLILRFHEVNDREAAVAKLQRLALVTRFSAKLRAPNPYTEPEYARWWKEINGPARGKEVDVAWKSEEGLEIGETSPIQRAMEMVADAYGKWRAVGRDRSNRPDVVDSKSRIAQARAAVTNAREAALFFLEYIKDRQAANAERRQRRD